MVTPVVTPSSVTSPVLTFSSTKAGTITYGGSCTSATTTAVVGNNTITLNALALGTYTNCTITVTDTSSNVSNVLSVPSFTISAVSGPTIPTNLLPNNTSTSAIGWNYSWNPSVGTGPLTYEVKTSMTSTVDGT